MTQEDFYNMQYSNGDVRQTIAQPGFIEPIRHVRDWLKVELEKRDMLDMTPELVDELTREDFLRFRRTVRERSQEHIESSVSNNSNSQSTKQYDYYNSVTYQIADFRKSVKRDSTLFPVLKDKAFFQQFDRDFKIEADAQGIIEITDPNYEPKSPEEKELFNLKQRYAYSVLRRCLKTDFGIMQVRALASTRDAQEVYRRVSEDALKSTTAIKTATDLEHEINELKLNDRYRGTYEGFLTFWKMKIDLLVELRGEDEPLSESSMKRMLKSAISAVKEFRDIEEQEAQDIEKGEKPYPFEKYYRTVQRKASSMDYENRKAYSSKKRDNRIVNYTSMTQAEFNSLYDEPSPSTVEQPDYSLFLTEAYKAISNQQSSRDQGHRQIPYFPPEIWKLIPDEVREYIRSQKKPPSSTNQSKASYKANVHEFNAEEEQEEWHDAQDRRDNPDYDDNDENLNEHQLNDEDDPDVQTFLAHMAQQVNQGQPDRPRLPPGDIRRTLGGGKGSGNRALPPNHIPKVKETKVKKTIVIDGVTYRSVNRTHIEYNVSRHEHRQSEPTSALVDRGANGTLAGSNVVVLETPDPERRANVTGIADHTVPDVPIATCAAKVNTNRGEAIAILPCSAYIGKGSTILSAGQLESFGLDVNDRSVNVGGKQMISTPCGYVIPITVRNGLPYIHMEKPTPEELDSLPHIFFCADGEWDPSVLDYEHDLGETWYDTKQEDIDPYGFPFDYMGRYQETDVNFTSQEYFFDAESNLPDVRHTILDELESGSSRYRVYSNATQPSDTFRSVALKDIDYESLRPNFAWFPVDAIKATFEATTQFGRNSYRLPFRKHFKARFPALNVHRRNEAVATDTVFSEVPAIDDGSTCAQIFVGRETLVTDVYGMKKKSEFIHTLEDQIRKRGAMDKLVSDKGQELISDRVKQLLRAYCIDDWQSEPYHQHQNFAESRWRTIQERTNITLERTGAPASTWLLCLTWICAIMNCMSTPVLNGKTPIGMLTGSTPDISHLTCFFFWEPVYFAVDDDEPISGTFPNKMKERLGRFVGFSESVGGPLTFKVLTEDTQKILDRSTVRSALTPEERNLRLSQLEGEPSDRPIREFIKSHSTEGRMKTLPRVDPDELIGRTFLTQPNENGETFRARVVRKIVQHDEDIENHPDKIKFLLSVGEDKADMIATYNDVLELLDDEIQRDIDREENGETYWKFTEIVGHQGPLKKGDKGYMGSRYNLMVSWSTGEITYEPLAIIGKDAPVEVARYLRDHNLLDEPGCKRFKRLARRDKKMIRLINQARLRSVRRDPIYQYGYQVPRNEREARELDKQNGNNKWKEAMELELSQLDEYDTFRDLGKGGKPPPGYKRINVHFVFAVKHDGRHKARLVANGSMTDPPIDSVYSGVVSLRALRMVVFLAELNGLELYQADVGNAYLEAKTKEKVYIIATAGFGDREGHLLIIEKALYGLRTSGARWHDRFADTLRDMGFVPSKAEPDVWMRRNGDVYEYIAVYVDDLACAAKNPKEILETLMSKYKYKLKGVGPIDFHLGCDFGRDPDGTLWFGPKRYVKKMEETYERLFGEKPKPYTSPLEKNDHPELDDTELLGSEDTKKYQSLIGAAQWLITLGRFDISSAVMTMGRFRSAPRRGHLDRIKRIYGYVSRFPNLVIRVRTEIPDYSDLDIPEFDWEYSVYGKVKEVIPNDIPEPLGKPVMTTTYHDANLYHDLMTGRAVTGILHFLNGTPIEWYSKRQATVETATYGSEFISAKIATEQIIDLRNTLRYLGVPVIEKSYLFGDNKSVVTSSTIPHSGLNKRHVMLSYHRVREAIASKFLVYIHIDGLLNVADVLSKHCGHQQFWPLVKPILFWAGDPMECTAGGEKERVSRKGT